MVYRKIPVYRDLTRIPIPVFLKIKYRYFSVFMYSTVDNFFKEVDRFLANFGDFLGWKYKVYTVPKNTGIPGFCKNTVPYRTGIKFLIPLGPVHHHP